MQKITKCLFLCFLCLTGCARLPLQTRQQAMRQVTPPPLQDDLPLTSLLQAVATEIEFLEKTPTHAEYVFGNSIYTLPEYLAGLRRILTLGASSSNQKEFFQQLTTEFDFYEVYGQKSWGQVFVTSYFEPIILGSWVKTDVFSSPLYQTPSDLVSLEPQLFDPKYESKKKWRGRLWQQSLLPYHTREAIDTQGALQGQGLEICWVDPIDSFFLQIQGSGTIRLKDHTEIHLNYAEQNGHPYEPIGKFLKSEIPPEQLNLATIEAYLRGHSWDEAQKILNRNPSYVFFQMSQQNALTYLGVPATAGRTIATDRRFFPKGALAFLTFQKPILDPLNPLQPKSFESTSRFVLDQDVGGAISGGGRVDLFWGSGDESKKYAGMTQGPGTLYYLAPKKAKP